MDFQGVSPLPADAKGVDLQRDVRQQNYHNDVTDKAIADKSIEFDSDVKLFDTDVRMSISDLPQVKLVNSDVNYDSSSTAGDKITNLPQ